MLSFPSQLSADYRMRALPEATPRGIGELFQDMGRQFLNSATNRVLGGVLNWASGVVSSGPPNTERIPYDRSMRYSELVLEKPLAGIRPSNLTRSKEGLDLPTKYWYENSLVANPAIYSLMNTYRYTYGSPSTVYLDAKKYSDKNGTVEADAAAEWQKGTLSPSLFNPYYGIQKIGTTRNTPLLDTDIDVGRKGGFSKDFTDCSISTLCKLSANDSSELGAAKYKYADFMYCKDLGMPNNRMLTLRRFSTPVGDMIFGQAATSADGVYSIPGDVGRLVGYFDTADNKLESILDYSFHAHYDEKTAETQLLMSQEDNRRSPLGMLLNTMAPQYQNSFNDSVAQGNNLLDWLIDGFGGLGEENKNFRWIKRASQQGTDSYYKPGEPDPINYDKNKVFDPVDTVRKTHLYTGELIFNHEFTLTFNYTLRSYDNINPKSAMLDLLANITATCYKRGHFWGGRQAILGAQPNIAGWQKANNIINKKWEELGGFFKSLSDGGLNIAAMWGNAANALMNQMVSFASSMKEANNTGQSDNAKTASNESENTKGAAGTYVGMAMGMIKSKMMNFLGRPQIYQFSSLLSGDNVGLWHLTIGNPRNPIAVMGNLIVTDCHIQQYGPLGQDDFPTGLKVVVTLKHARPRDMVDIQKMYTRGILAIYQNTNTSNITASTPGGTIYVGETNQEKLKRNVDEIA